MANSNTTRPEQPTETVQRRPTDVMWFTVLILSIATGIGMTLFAPVGDEPKGAAALPPSTIPAFEPLTTSPTTGPGASQPATAPAL
jgi:hypothetical protein